METLKGRINENETNLLDSVHFYALRNKHSKFMIPSEENLIDGIKYSKVLLETGCATLSIPYPTTLTFDAFWTRYQTYLWSVKSIGVGHHHKVALSISGGTDEAFQIKLGSAKASVYTKTLRFILPYDIVDEILKKKIFVGPKHVG